MLVATVVTDALSANVRRVAVCSYFFPESFSEGFFVKLRRPYNTA